MKLTIDKVYSKDFIDYIVDYIGEKVIDTFNNIEVQKIDQEFNINTYQVFKLAVRNLIIKESSTNYTITINKNIRYNGNNLNSLVNMITYGNRTCKGYPLIEKIFNLVHNNIDILYKEWLIGY